MWLQERVLNNENGKEKWQGVVTYLSTPPAERVSPSPVAAAGPVPVLPPSQHAASFAAFANFGAR